VRKDVPKSQLDKWKPETENNRAKILGDYKLRLKNQTDVEVVDKEQRTAVV